MDIRDLKHSNKTPHVFFTIAPSEGSPRLPHREAKGRSVDNGSNAHMYQAAVAWRISLLTRVEPITFIFQQNFSTTMYYTPVFDDAPHIPWETGSTRHWSGGTSWRNPSRGPESTASTDGIDHGSVGERAPHLHAGRCGLLDEGRRNRPACTPRHPSLSHQQGHHTWIGAVDGFKASARGLATSLPGLEPSDGGLPNPHRCLLCFRPATAQ